MFVLKIIGNFPSISFIFSLNVILLYKLCSKKSFVQWKTNSLIRKFVPKIRSFSKISIVLSLLKNLFVQKWIVFSSSFERFQIVYLKKRYFFRFSAPSISFVHCFFSEQSHFFTNILVCSKKLCPSLHFNLTISLDNFIDIHKDPHHIRISTYRRESIQKLPPSYISIYIYISINWKLFKKDKNDFNKKKYFFL